MTQAAIDSWLQMKTDARSCQGGQRRRHGAAAGQCRPLQSGRCQHTATRHQYSGPGATRPDHGGEDQKLVICYNRKNIFFVEQGGVKW